MSNLDRSLFDYDESIEKSSPLIPGELGISINGNRYTEVPRRGHFVYVRLRSNLSEVIQAFNDKVFPGYGLPVLVKWNNTRYEVVGRDGQRYPEWEAGNPYLDRHGETHSFNKEGSEIGTDPVWVHSYQFMPGLVSPFSYAGARNVYINPFVIYMNGDWKHLGNTGTSSLFSYRPYSGSSLVLVTVDTATGNPTLFATTGSYIPTLVTGSQQYISYLPDINKIQYIPLGYVALTSGTSTISWNNVYDVRQFVNDYPSLQINTTDGIDTIQFSGLNVSVTGTVAYVSSTGGGGGGTWGSITGTLSAQTDLQTALDGKVDENAAITGATKTKITYDAKGLVTAGADATQDDIADGATYKQYSGTEKTKLAGIETAADVTDIANVGAALNGASADTPLDADTFHFWDAVDAVMKDITWLNIKATLKTYFDTIYAALVHTHDYVSMKVKNTSGATAVAGDVGYIDSAGEYKTTTTAQDAVAWCVVITGAANNADIYVARRGRVTVNYTGTAPSAGHFLSTSTVAGSAQRETAMHPSIFAVCTAAGSGGTVEVQLLCLTIFRPLVKSTDILRINGMSDSNFVATINGTPGASTLVYNAPSSGNENTIVPASASEVGNLVCFNTTRGTSALVDSVNTGTNTITFVTAPPTSSANGDTITFRSTTFSSTIDTGVYLYEIDLTGCSLPGTTRAVALSCQAHDSGAMTGSEFGFIHKLSASAAFGSGISWIADWSHIIIPAIDLISSRIMFGVGASGTGTMSYFIVRLNGVWEAVP